MGKEFTLNVFLGVNEFVHAIFEAVLALYDPDIEGYLEEEICCVQLFGIHQISCSFELVYLRASLF